MIRVVHIGSRILIFTHPRYGIRMDPKLLAGSGSDPDPELLFQIRIQIQIRIRNRIQKQICKKEPYNQTKKQVFSNNNFFLHIFK
jgi:hypothetical protein